MALVERKINLTFTLGEGSFGTSGQNTVKVSGLRASAKINNAGGPQAAQLSLDVWGLTPSIMGQLATLGPKQPNQYRRNVVTVDAGDDVNGIATVFVGQILNAYSDYQSSPQVAFHIEATSSYLESLIPVPPLAFPNSFDVVTALSGLAHRMNLAIEPNGVQKTLPASYFPGTAKQQVAWICDHAGIEYNIENDTLALWEPNGSRGGNILLITKDTGLMGYPSYTVAGIIFKVIHNPAIGFGRQVEIKSSRPELIGANGTWKIIGLDYSLDANYPAGDWSDTVQAVRTQYGKAVPTPS